jgi:hypothetical protein
VACPRSTSSTKRFIRCSRESDRENRTTRRLHTARVTTRSYRTATVASGPLLDSGYKHTDATKLRERDTKQTVCVTQAAA